jgi:hypothetical protein
MLKAVTAAEALYPSGVVATGRTIIVLLAAGTEKFTGEIQD